MKTKERCLTYNDDYTKQMLAESKKALQMAKEHEKQSRRMEMILDEFMRYRKRPIEQLPSNVRRLKISPNSGTSHNKLGIVVSMDESKLRKSRTK